ncbi:hypothetical protein SH584_12395 [Sphingomonas sp. LY29]|uniref:hypothetical protein n=1 Tax=Sphingomonas sp. LY29 TaxID=3095341 RepID=UPI002D77DED9|nr:hypothetical protein [Sphingomonas sp. LY29]WRP25829.1 hypothetical protein SH584_12395 [Sphingomonas sp. LY29]
MSRALKAQMYLNVAHGGAALMVALGLAYALDLPDFVKGFAVGMLVVLVLVLFWSKLRDEYIQRLWNVGTAAAFIVTLGLTLLADIVTGFASATLDTPTGTPGIGAFNVGLAALAAFYVGFHVAMVKERP